MQEANSVDKARELQESLQLELEDAKEQIAANIDKKKAAEQTLAQVRAQGRQDPDLKLDPTELVGSIHKPANFE